jgi:hypothetical protein
MIGVKALEAHFCVRAVTSVPRYRTCPISVSIVRNRLMKGPCRREIGRILLYRCVNSDAQKAQSLQTIPPH